MRKERNNCKAMLNHLKVKLKNIIDHLQLIPKSSNKHQFDVVEFVETPRANNEMVPNDVKEGYFAVFSVNSEEEPKRFIVELCWLTDPSFLELLKQTEDEYGFGQKGVLEVHCLAAELQKILIKLKIGV
ncbi:auxin-responsive protein SAUR32-like [Solanum stenotomum]|uniref:auxin-responsive protein SAUR32-like n=1 Tax=Solanum stenotomum TaxID=172797 RepID=UPI0020D0F388|nr:auxin-responsive protein SAUR32-like [Solanum stenotomum]